MLQIVIKANAIGVALMLAGLGAASAAPVDAASAVGRPAVGIQDLSGPGTVLYTADWSTGLNGWAGSGDWKTLRGVLLNDGTGGSRTPILAPARIGTVTDYAVEARIRAVRVSNGFGLVLRRQPDGGGYTAAIRNGDVPAIRYGDDAGSLTEAQPFDPGNGWHTYRLEADGNVVTFLIDGARIATLTDNRYLDGGLTGLVSYGYQLEVSSFRIIQLR
jgi:hypothetical protein